MPETPSPQLPGLSCESTELYYRVVDARCEWQRKMYDDPKYLYVGINEYNHIRASRDLHDYGCYHRTLAGVQYFMGLPIVRVAEQSHLALGM